MAILDRRLIPLIEILTDLGLDWLAFEMVDGIRRGREPEETAQDLMVARKQVRDGEMKSVESKPIESVEAELLLGDDQLNWAADYLAERLEAIFAEMSASLNNIDGIIGTTDSHLPAASLVLRDGEEDWTVDDAIVKEAQSQLPKLRKALTSWFASTRTDLAQ